jgi:hypothetical protein
VKEEHARIDKEKKEEASKRQTEYHPEEKKAESKSH